MDGKGINMLSYFLVVISNFTEIIGGPGEIMSEVGQKGDDLYTVIYVYKGEGSLGANANFTFQSGKLQMEAQAGLK